MFSSNATLNSPIEHWPSDWQTLLKELSVYEEADKNSFWKKLVSQYLTSYKLDEDTESAYKEFFHQFWIEEKPRFASNPEGIIEAAADGYDIYIKNWLARLKPDEKDILLKQKLSLGDSALHVATENRHTSTVRVLLDNGADPNVKGFMGETPLHRAAYYNLIDIIELLLKHGASCEEKRNDDEKPIHVAAMMGRAEAVALFVKFDQKQLNTPGREDRTPFYRAGLDGQIQVMTILISMGADPNQINFFSGKSILHMAAMNNKPDVIVFLAKKGANLNLTDMSGYTPLQRCAMQLNPSLEAANVLIELGANVNTGNPPPIHLLSLNGDKVTSRTKDFARLLIANHAKIDNATSGLLKRM